MRLACALDRMPDDRRELQFLERVRAQWPDTVRLLLTGYADIQSILDAINRGELWETQTKHLKPDARVDATLLASPRA